MANKYQLDIFPEMYTNPLTRVRGNQGGQSQGLFSELLQPAPRSFLDSTVANLMGRGDPNAALRKEYQSATNPERIKILNRLATTPEQQLAVNKMQQNLETQQKTDQARTQGLAFKSAVVDKAVKTGKPEDVTLIQSLDPVQDREMLIQYFRTGTFNKPVVVGNKVFDIDSGKFISPEEDKKEEKVKLTFEKLDNGTLIGLNPYTGEEVTRFSPDKNDPSGVKFMAIADAEYFIRDKIDPAIDFINKSIQSRRTVGGVESVPFKYVPGTDEHTLVNQYYISIASDEAFAALEELRKQAMASGARGSGLGQITQNEFRALKDNLTALQNAVELPPEAQITLLNEVRERRLRIARLAAGENPVNVVDWNSPALKEAGYEKGTDGHIYYESLDGSYSILNTTTGNFDKLP